MAGKPLAKPLPRAKGRAVKRTEEPGKQRRRVGQPEEVPQAVRETRLRQRY